MEGRYSNDTESVVLRMDDWELHRCKLSLRDEQALAEEKEWG